MDEIKKKYKFYGDIEYKKFINEKSDKTFSKYVKKYSSKKNIKSKYIKLKLKKKQNIKYILIIVSFLLIIILSFVIIFTNLFRHNLNYDDEDDNVQIDNETIYYQEKFDSYKDAFNKAKDFIDMNIKGILINTEKVKLSKKPKASVVMPCYNCRKYILRAIRSVQNQNLSNFEIIIINDYSDDDTLSLLEQLQKEDNRIRIINNKNNSGILYSRSIGALSANGKYIFTLDSDDMFLDKDVLSTITNIADKGNFDFIIFNSIHTDLKPDVYSTKIYAPLSELSHKPNLVLLQPDLGYLYPIAPSHKMGKVDFTEVLISGKCAKTKIYKKGLKKLGKERYTRYMISGEDSICNIILFNTAKIAKFIPKFGYLYIQHKNSSSRKQKDKIIDFFNLLFILDSLIEFAQDLPNNKKVLVNYILFLSRHKYMKDALNSDEFNNKTLISCLDRILNCKYISDELKNEVRIRFKKFDFIKYNF